MANLVNSGILPLTFANEADYDTINQGDILTLKNAREQIRSGNELVLTNITANKEIKVLSSLSGRQVDILLAGGLLNYTRNQS